MAASSFLSAITRRLEGKVAVITGGASGIGGCTAKLFANHGAKVVIADVQDELGHSVREDIGQSNCTYVHCDVSNEDHIRNAVDKAVDVYGKLDIMFNNAGISGPQKPRIVDNEKADFERVLAINVMGVFLGMKHAARVMVPAKRGTIISTASIGSVIGGATAHAYCCSKHAVLGLTRNLAVELGQFGIRVNCVSPYGVSTPMALEYVGNEDQVEMVFNTAATLKGVTLKTEDLANAALFLASDDAKYISGHNLLVDGGFTINNAALNIFKYPQDS
ncbi:Secoisolariciresinol dehydrogenase [Actinidia chinensis var. chinensis]|uniref:Secoisolariciresinol dehydrogenase n=1 Tax=Actinidia chinensis var. chinensis TaxID=1590841 RepID=A0A2R6QVY6_ACTCC|nr:Secoisolariciresinol dehydrogenase [Actinidia chinensis var. chinensis]